jgi:uncharacterized membrane protein
MNQKTRSITHAALIGAMYFALTHLQNFLLPNTASMVIQFRASEALCVLALFTPAAIPGLTLGCLLSNTLMMSLPQDIIFGSLATLIGAVGARLLVKFPYLSPLPTVAANTLIVPFVLAYAYHVEEGLPFLFATVGIGEILSAYICGVILYLALRKHQAAIFGVPAVNARADTESASQSTDSPYNE